MHLNLSVNLVVASSAWHAMNEPWSVYSMDYVQTSVFLSGIDWTGLTVLSTLLRRWPMDDVDDDCDDDDEEADNACQKQLLLSTQ